MDKESCMKIAVVLSGKPRFLEESSFWWKNRILNQCPPDIEIDFYCHFWNDDEIDLDKRIVDTFNPVKYSTDSYHEWYESFSQRVLEYNKNYEFCYDELPHKRVLDVPNWLFFHGHSYDTRHRYFPRHPAYNFYGQYISSNKAVSIIGKEKTHDYDLVLKTRSDLCIDSNNFFFHLNKLFEHITWHKNKRKEDRYLITCYNRVINEVSPDVMFNINIHTCVYSCYSNNIVPPDLIFASDGRSAWYYYSNIEDKIYNLLTKDKNILLGLHNRYTYVYTLAHIFWSILSIDKNIFLIDVTSAPAMNNINTTLIRKQYDETELQYLEFDGIKKYTESEEFEIIRSSAEWNAL